MKACLRLFLAAPLALVVLAAATDPPAEAVEDEPLAAGSRPNIVLIMTDDLDEGLLETAVREGLMPHLSSTFRDAGTRLIESFVSNSLCCPSRATFLTGLYTHNHGVLTNTEPYGYEAFDDRSTLATWLQAAGYATGFVGKYLNGYDGRRDLDGDGEPDDLAYVPPGWSYWQGLLDPSTYLVYGYDLLNGDTLEIESYPDRYQTDLLREKSVAFLNASESEDDTPFFLWINPLAPHVERGGGLPPVCVTAAGAMHTIRPAPRHAGDAEGIEVQLADSVNEADIDDKPNWLQTWVPQPLTDEELACIEGVYRDKLESMQAVDDLIGAVVGWLEALDEGHTVLVFTSDNGFLHGEHRLIKKTYAYEEAIRVPLYVRNLEASAPATIDELVVNNDLAPTLAALAGASVPAEVDGRSLLPLFAAQPVESWRNRILVEHFEDEAGGPVPAYAALRRAAASGRPLLYAEYEPPAGDSRPGCVPGSCELYLLDGDPAQLRSLDQEPAFQDLIGTQEMLLGWLVGCGGDLCRLLEDL